MLITAGDIGSYNTMTASWGQFGILWSLPVATCYIRPQRYTYGFAEKSDYFTLSFFSKEYRKALQLCGSKSGREIDKAREAGLTPFETEFKAVSFKEARMIIECKKLYTDFLRSDNFIEEDLIRKNYPESDFHRFYIGEVKRVWVRKDSDSRNFLKDLFK